MFTTAHHPIRRDPLPPASPFGSPYGKPPSGRPPFHTARHGRVRRVARGIAALALVAGVSAGVIGGTGVGPASAWEPPGPSGMPVSQGNTTHLSCNSINIDGADVISYIEAPQENHGVVHPGEELWVSYQIHKASNPQQWPLSANNGVYTTTWPALHFNAPTNTMIDGPVQVFTPAKHQIVASPQLVPSAMHVFGDMQGRPIYPGTSTQTHAEVTKNTGPAVYVNVDGDSNPNGSYNDGFYLEVRFPVRVMNTGTVTVQSVPSFGGEDGTWNVYMEDWETYKCSNVGSGATGLSFTSTPYLLYYP